MWWRLWRNAMTESEVTAFVVRKHLNNQGWGEMLQRSVNSRRKPSDAADTTPPIPRNADSCKAFNEPLQLASSPQRWINRLSASPPTQFRWQIPSTFAFVFKQNKSAAKQNSVTTYLFNGAVTKISRTDLLHSDPRMIQSQCRHHKHTHLGYNVWPCGETWAQQEVGKRT